MIVETLALLVVILSVALPGLALSFALLHKTAADKLEKAFVGVILGLFVPASLAVVEAIALGVQLTFAVCLFNSALITAIALAAYYCQAKSFPKFSFKWREEYSAEDFWMKVAKSNKTKILLLLVIAFGFYGRYATSADPFFSEIDPYYYEHLTQFVAQTGSIPLYNMDAYAPQLKFNHFPPLVHYAAASWYQVYQGITGISFSKDIMIAFNQLYPPLVGALLSFLGYLLVKQEADRRIALVVAALFAFTPQLIQKLAAGVTEQQPFGLFASIMILTFYAVAIKQKSLRWGVMAGLSTFMIMIGTSQAIWPLMVLTGFMAISSVLGFWANDLDRKAVIISWMAVAGAVIGNMAYLAYANMSVFSLYNGVQLLIAAAVPSTLLFLAEKYKLFEKAGLKSKAGGNQKWVALAAIGAFVLLAFAFTPLGDKAVSYINATMGFAKPNSAIMMTVAEEAPASDAFDYSSYGMFSRSLAPKNLLIFSAMLSYAIAAFTLWRKGKHKAVWASLAVVAFVFVFNSAFDAATVSVAGQFGLSQVAQNLGESDVFYYMGLAVISSCITYLYSERKNTLPLLFILIFFPISFIGLSKLKYIAHLATALPIAVGFVLFSLWELFELLSHYFGSDSHKAARFGRGAVLALGFVFAFVQFAHAAGSPVTIACSSTGWGKTLNGFTSQLSIPGYAAPSTIGQLCGTRLDDDWIDAMSWMGMNLGSSDRVLSWWDYGHWTTFIAQKKTALDPGNAYPEYNQETARALVHGPQSELVRVMKYHNSTYLMLDAELIQKWGALNFLAGSFEGLYREPNPADNYNVTPQLDWTVGTGASTWELEHAYEFLYTVYTVDSATGQPSRMTCPGLVSRQALYSQLTGAIYCVSSGADGANLFALTSASGDQVLLKDPKLVQAGSDSMLSLSQIGGSGSGIYINTHASASPYLINLNPDLATLSNGTRKSYLYNSPFVQLFFLESLPGFELVHKTPNNRVKIFRLTE